MIKNLIYKFFFKKFFHKKLYMIGLSHLLNMREKYKNIEYLNDVDYKIFSQNGEDGIVDYLLYQLKIEKPKFLEIGVGDYTEANTRFIFEKSSLRGTIIDCIDDFEEKVRSNLTTWKGELNIINQFINSSNISNIMNQNNSLTDIDLFSLDIDGIDYWILKKLPKNFSKIAIIEYNPLFGKDLEVTVPNIDNFNRTNYHYSNLCFGMSIKAAINLMIEKNFYFVGTNLFRNNAFFVNNSFKKDDYFKNLKINNLDNSVDANFTESRDKNKKLNYLKLNEKINEILSCDVVNLSSKEHKIVSLKRLIN